MANSISSAGQLSSANPARAVDFTSPVEKFNFPLDNDSYQGGQKDVSSHTIMIFSYKTNLAGNIEDATSTLGQNLGEITTFIGDIASSALTGLTGTSFFSGDTSIIREERAPLIEDRARRISSSSRLEGLFQFYMPQPIIFPLTNDYEDLSLTEAIGGAAWGGTTSAFNVGNGVLGGMLDAGTSGFVFAAKNLGYPINPKMEILYRNTYQRKFEFNFAFNPGSQKESDVLRNMLTTLRAHASPTRVGGGIFWRAPNTFDIMFLHNGQENTQIPKISECVIENIEINYTPTNTGWTTFTNGHPVSTTLRLSFRELEPIDRGNIVSYQNGGNSGF